MITRISHPWAFNHTYTVHVYMCIHVKLLPTFNLYIFVGRIKYSVTTVPHETTYYLAGISIT